MFVSWTYIARIIRGQVLSLREKEFVEAHSARWAPATCGSSSATSSPTCVAPILIYATLIIPANILFEAYLSFLGLGVQPPHRARWGETLSDASPNLRPAWW